MTEREIVDRTYEATIQQMSTQLFNVLLISRDADERDRAEQTFQAGVRKARDIRDRLKQLLPLE
jgi:hypothetical protein